MAKEDGILFGRRSIRISGGSALEAMASLTRADENDLIKLALGNNFDYVCASLNHRSKDIRYIRDVLGPKGENINVLVKIDNLDSLHNFKDLIQNADGAILCREDLNSEVPSEKLIFA